MIWEHPKFAGAPHKVEVSISYHIGSPITGLAMGPTKEYIIYGSVTGEIGVLIPISNYSTVQLLRQLEAAMYRKIQSPCGRNIEMFRSYYSPKKCVIDGTFVKRFFDLPEKDQHDIANNLKCSPLDISKIINIIESKF